MTFPSTLASLRKSWLTGLKAIFSGLPFALLLISCNSNTASKGEKDSLANHLADSGQQKIADNSGTLTINPAVLKRYQQAFQEDTASYDKKFVADFNAIIKKFNGKKLDTTILTIGNLDGDAGQDTIISRVYYEADSIYVDSKWIKDHQVLWKDNYTDPYRELNAGLLDSTRNTWVFFAIGVLYGPPEIHPRNEMDSNTLNIVYDLGVKELNSAGMHTDKERYKTYLHDFKGDLLTYGQPESREGSWVWYKPAARMLTYFQP